MSLDPLIKSDAPAPTAAEPDWEAVRKKFVLHPGRIHLAASLFLASHPVAVRAAIARYREELDRDPVRFVQENEFRLTAAARGAAADYFHVRGEQVTLTQSTTAGLGLIYGGMPLRPGDEILTSGNEYFSHHRAQHLLAARTGATVRQIDLYRDSAAATADEIIGRLTAQLRAQTKLVALSWVYSGTGLKLPVQRVASLIQAENRRRPAADAIVFLLDGVHGVGAEASTFDALGCDFLVSGCHKWLFGPRGTGVIISKPGSLRPIAQVIPSFGEHAFRAWLDGTGESPPRESLDGIEFTPGGFVDFEHRWALTEAFELHREIGAARIAARVRQLNTFLKEGLRRMPSVIVHTPSTPELSAGITCFEIEHRAAADVVAELRTRSVIVTATPSRRPLVRAAPGIINSESDLRAGLLAIAACSGLTAKEYALP
jgi:selenocysteine lyase/cysteine desulfurase